MPLAANKIVSPVIPTPSGTRDVLPDEMRELRRITESLREVFESAGYGEVITPTLEYESVLQQAELELQPAYRLFDEHGDVLTLRTDMTIPIARLVATRYADASLPLRFCYCAHAYRSVSPKRGHSREFLQAGIELVGAPAPIGTAQALTVLSNALAAVGLDDYRIGLGDAGLYPALLRSFELPAEVCNHLLAQLVERDFVGLEHAVNHLDLSESEKKVLIQVPQLRGNIQTLSAVAAQDPVTEKAAASLLAVVEQLDSKVIDHLICDFGLAGALNYYTGAIFEVYDPAVGTPIGRGGRYDDLLRKFGFPAPAVGFALNVERLHIAVTGEERIA
jgi:ATP phosphoribosyltransferase regulatory subunit